MDSQSVCQSKLAARKMDTCPQDPNQFRMNDLKKLDNSESWFPSFAAANQLKEVKNIAT
jgi:hypothetical protein